MCCISNTELYHLVSNFSYNNKYISMIFVVVLLFIIKQAKFQFVRYQISLIKIVLHIFFYFSELVYKENFIMKKIR